MQGNDTKSENLGNDYQIGWSDFCESNHGLGREKRWRQSVIKEDFESNLLMGSVVTLIAEWFSLGETIKLQELFALTSVNLRERHNPETLDWIEDQVWDGMTEEWAEHIYGEGNSSALKNLCD